MALDVVAKVEVTLDAAIRGFTPGDPESYAHWDAELVEAEGLLGEPAAAEQRNLLASVRAQRILIAADCGLLDHVIEQSDRFLQDFPPTDPSYCVVVALRSRALHATGDHQKEVEEILLIALESAIDGSEFIFLLDELARRHPDGIPAEAGIAAKVWDAITVLRDLGYDTLPAQTACSTAVAEIIRLTAEGIRSTDRRMGEELLSGESP